MEQENKALRSLLERMVEHRQKSHAEIVTHAHLARDQTPHQRHRRRGLAPGRAQFACEGGLRRLAKGQIEESQIQPAILKVLEKTKRELVAAVKPAVEELIRLERRSKPGMLESLVKQPDNFFSPALVRANRGFVKGQLPRERVVKEFGPEALVLFKDLTTDLKLNPRPKPDEIMLVFQNDFERRSSRIPTSSRRNGRTCWRCTRKSSKARFLRHRPRAKERFPPALLRHRAAALLRKPEHGIAGCDFCPAPAAPD